MKSGDKVELKTVDEIRQECCYIQDGGDLLLFRAYDIPAIWKDQEKHFGKTHKVTAVFEEGNFYIEGCNYTYYPLFVKTIILLV